MTNESQTISYNDGVITLIDQTQIPRAEVYLEISTVQDLVAAIKRLSVRGAPAIGVAGAYGVALAARLYSPLSDAATFNAKVSDIRQARPTAVNLAHMVDRVNAVVTERVTAQDSAEAIYRMAVAEAHSIRDEELQASIAMGELGADLVQQLCEAHPHRDPNAIRAMTICNTGGLATVQRGTALAVIQTLHERGNLAEAVPLETRPLLQGGRLTAWELQKMGAPFRLIVDSAGPFLLSRDHCDVVLIGADRIAKNGDTANKIGSFSLGLAAKYAEVPFIVVAPESTLDPNTETGAGIEIEDRGAKEVASVFGHQIAPDGINAINPAFDVTPVSLITALVTDKRVVRFDLGQGL